MRVNSNVGPLMSVDTQITRAECEVALRRVCFGHLAFVRAGHADVLPIRYAYLEGWVYFRADLNLRRIIAQSPWLALSVTELDSGNRVSSIIVRGGCYETEGTGTGAGDAAALRGIMELRDPTTTGRERKPRVRRSSIVFRLHVDELRGVSVSVPCPAGDGLGAR